MALITPEKLAASGTEDGTQMAFIQACRTELQASLPEVMLLYHVPNGGQRGDSRSAQITMAKMKGMGLVSGVPDIVLPVGRIGFSNLYIEFKSPDKKGRLGFDQYEYIKLLTNNGNLVAILDCWQQAFQLVREYLQGNEKVKLLTLDGNYDDGIPAGTLIDVNKYVKKMKDSAAWKKHRAG